MTGWQVSVASSVAAKHAFIIYARMPQNAIICEFCLFATITTREKREFIF
jgi:hypothetical protein